MKRRTFTRILAIGALVAASATAARAEPQAWPKGPVHIIVPFAAGSTPDVIARLVSEQLSTRIGKPVVIDNKPGAAGNIGTDMVAKAVPDGQTIGVSIAGPLAVNSLLFKKLPYDPAHDLEPITIAATQPAVLVVSNVPGAATSAAGLFAMMKQNPGKYSFASMGAGTVSHLAMQALSSRNDADLVHVPYGGSSAATTAVMTGEVNMAVLPAAAVMPFIKAGKLRALAIASAKRSTLLPDLPTLAESGVPDIQADAWVGFIAPAKTPPEIISRLHEELVQILAEPAIKEKLKLQYMEPVADSSSEFRGVLAADVARWKPVIQKLNITLD
jgi:tripartite-type tricarboxylate transporter receptor subunit TctC